MGPEKGYNVLTDELTANLTAWRKSLQLAYVGGVRNVPPTLVADKISHIAIITTTGTSSLPLTVRSLYMDARSRRERSTEVWAHEAKTAKSFRIYGVIKAISSALASAT